MNKQLGRYELRRTIGRGAAGTVWEAWDTTLTRRVAIKVVRPGSTNQPEIEELLARFRQEAQVASCLSHVGVVQVHDYGEADGEAYIVMEFVEGGTLKTLLDREDRLPLARASEIMTGVLQALEQCHRQSIVHRDIKPGNIMLAAGGGVKLADFGIARTENSELTTVGTVMGTPAYMSPEQFTAREPADFRTDIWACGILFYEMLTGTRPFAGPSMAVIGQAVVNDPVNPPSRLVPGLPAAVDEVVLRALRKKPADRFDSAEAFAQAIQAAGALPQSRKAGLSGRSLGIAGGLAALVALGGAWLWFGPQRPQTSLVIPPPSVPAQVADLPCSTVTVTDGPGGITAMRGIIGAGAPREALDAIIARARPGTVTAAIQSFPATEVSCRLAELVRANAGAVGTSLVPVDGRTRLVTGDEIRLLLAMPNFDGEVHLEDLDSDGKISNMMEGNLGTLPRQRAGTRVGLGVGGDTLIGLVSPPYGADIFVAIVSSAPLFSARRPDEETGARFVADLDAAMAALRRRGGQVAADAIVLTTTKR